MKEIRTHDTINREHDVEMGSEKAFGITFAVVFCLLAFVPLLHHGGLWYWSFGVAAVFLALAYLRPGVLKPLNRGWFKFGLFLHKILSPVVMFVVFLLAIIPTGLIRKMLGKDTLRLKKPDVDSYWITREPPGPDGRSYERQF